MASQAKLLRVLQSGEFIKVGSSKVQKTDVRVIAATNVNLLYAVGKGKFREDLYYRLNAIQIKMPALRERKEDIYLLFRKFTSDFSEKYGMGKVSLANDAIDLLINYRWPGNIRQLKNVAESVTALESEKLTRASERCVVDARTLSGYMPKEEASLLPVTAAFEPAGGQMPDSDKQMIIKAIFDLKQEVDRLKARLDAVPEGVSPIRPALRPAAEPEEAEWQGSGTPVTNDDVGKVVDIKAESPHAPGLSLKDTKIQMVEKALEKHGGNRKLAAQELGTSERTLYRWLDKYHIDVKPDKGGVGI